MTPADQTPDPPADPQRSDLLVPPGTRVLHIGPHKTGTTTLQRAFHAARPRLAEHGVLYAGNAPQPVQAAAHVAGVRGLVGTGRPSEGHWRRLCREAATTGDRRMVISSEYFSNADDDRARVAVDGLGGPLVHVVVTLRRLLRVAPSQWQQYVQNRVRLSYAEWLEITLDRPDESPTRHFWIRHDHGALVERWAKLVGPDNCTVLVIDDGDRDVVLRGFESLVGLPDGFLIPPDDGANRSLGYGEAELVRALNGEFAERGWSEAMYHKVLRQGTVRRLHRQIAADAAAGMSRSQPIGTPRSSAERLCRMGAEMADRIEGLGVRVIGDLDVLRRPPAEKDVVDRPPEPTLTAEAAAGALADTVQATIAFQASRQASTPSAVEPTSPAPEPARPAKAAKPPAATPADRPVRQVPSGALLRIVARRGLRRLTRITRLSDSHRRRPRDG